MALKKLPKNPFGLFLKSFPKLLKSDIKFSHFDSCNLCVAVGVPWNINNHLWVNLHYTRARKKRDDFEMKAFSLTLNITARSWSNLAMKDSFEIRSSKGFWNCLLLLDLIKIWLRYCGLKRRLQFQNRLFFSNAGVYF